MTHFLDTVLQAAGLPAPTPEYRFAPPRRWRFDYAWLAYRVALEVEGGTWSGGRHGRGYERDCENYSKAAVLGWRMRVDACHVGRTAAP